MLQIYNFLQRATRGNNSLIATLHSCRMFSSKVDSFINMHDHTQVALLAEPCILVDPSDTPIGQASKKDCHLLTTNKTNQDTSLLHRAFSVFIFNTQNQLLVTQRSTHKILFPNHWTNACCSHPLYTEAELNGHSGVQQAARRRVQQELGIDTSALRPEQFEYITRIQYHADNTPYDGVFGENEIDYCLVLRGDFRLVPNLNEVKSVKYLGVKECREFLAEGERHESGVLLTPWFRMICERFLFEWWERLEDLSSVKDHSNIHKLN